MAITFMPFTFMTSAIIMNQTFRKLNVNDSVISCFLTSDVLNLELEKKR